MNVSRSLQRLGLLSSRPSVRSFSSSLRVRSSAQPPRGWTPTPFVTETVVSISLHLHAIGEQIVTIYREVAGTPVRESLQPITQALSNHRSYTDDIFSRLLKVHI